jgi:hypothetical protein
MVLETLLVWQLLQVKHLRNTPLILVGGMWPGLVEWARAVDAAHAPAARQRGGPRLIGTERSSYD